MEVLLWEFFGGIFVVLHEEVVKVLAAFLRNERGHEAVVFGGLAIAFDDVSELIFVVLFPPSNWLVVIPKV